MTPAAKLAEEALGLALAWMPSTTNDGDRQARLEGAREQIREALAALRAMPTEEVRKPEPLRTCEHGVVYGDPCNRCSPRCTCYVLPHEDNCGLFMGITQSGERVYASETPRTDEFESRIVNGDEHHAALVKPLTNQIDYPAAYGEAIEEMGRMEIELADALAKVAAMPSPQLRRCPYCTSDNQAIRDTYYDQTCEGCVKRMGQ